MRSAAASRQTGPRSEPGGASRRWRGRPGDDARGARFRPARFGAGPDPGQASAMHFLVKLVLAAPDSFFSAALASHAAIVDGASVSHFLTKLVLAAPASFFSLALASHAAAALEPASASHFLTKLVFAAPATEKK